MNTVYNDFDSEETLNYIINLMKKEENVKIYRKLSFLRFRAMGYSVDDASERCFISKSYGYKIQDEWFEGGYDKLLPKKRKEGSGRKTKLNKRQIKQLKKILDTEDDLTLHDIIKIIHDKWNIKFTYNGIKNLLIKQFDIDITKYLDYNPKSNIQHTSTSNDVETLMQESKEELKPIIDLLQNEKDVFIYRKLLSFILQLLGFKLDSISNIIGITKQTLFKWKDQWENGGYEALKRKKGQGRKPELSSKEWEEIRKIMSTRNDWTLSEISYKIEKEYGVKYTRAHLAVLLRKKLNMHYAKPYPKDYRQSPYYKQEFHLKLMHIFKKYKLKYDPNTGNIINMETNEKFHIFSFDEASFQFTSNNVRLWALIKPMLEKDTTLFKCKAMGTYALSPHSNDYLEFVENQKSVTVIDFFQHLRDKNPEGVIVLLIDNFSAHKTDDVLKKAKELNIELCFLPTYSPQLQPIEKVWKAIKLDVALFKIDSVEDYKDLNKKQRLAKLKEIIGDSFYDVVESKNKWNKVFNNYILPKIKLYSPEFNEDWEVQKI